MKSITSSSESPSGLSDSGLVGKGCVGESFSPGTIDCGTFEARFYRRVAGIPDVARRMPRLLASDEVGCAVLLEEVEGARDRTSLHGGDILERGEATELGSYLSALHSTSRSAPDPSFANREMRALNHAHLFVVPLSPDNGLDLDRFEVGLSESARRLASDRACLEEVDALGRRYLDDGPCLVHGDYFPGSWLRHGTKLRVIDAEFSFYGRSEVDVGVALGHLAPARQRLTDARELFRASSEDGVAHDAKLVAGYAGVEVMRRLIGVAQLPVPASSGLRRELLERSRASVLCGEWESLWG